MQRSVYTIIIYIALLLLPCLSIRAAEMQAMPQGDSIRLSLLTCGPGEEIYSLFGHTAIRYEAPQRGVDVVFNYGLFSFDTPNFILRFTLGETDYQLGVTDYRRFIASYWMEGRDVWQQTLNLTLAEKRKLIRLLEENYKPENRVYRYNFFYDNCATRPRDQVERAVDGRLRYADDMESTDTGRSFRDIVHQYCEGHPWARFGIDMCLGSEADRPINRRQMMFAPFYVKDFFASATLADSTGARPLVADTEQVLAIPADAREKGSAYPSPMQAALCLLLAVGIATWIGIRKGKSLWGIDLVLFFAAGVAGCFWTLLSFFSQHPAVGSNYILFVFHPLHLLCLPLMLRKVIKKQMSYYMVANGVVLTLFIVLFGVIPQEIHWAVLPLALCLLIRSASNLLICRKQTKR